MAKSPGLTISMIVRDESANLEELLPAIVPGVDDIVIVDTGSTDGTIETAKRLGARVFEQPWDDDFSKARNRGLDEVRTSHVLWLDADDRMEPGDLERIRETIARDPGTAWMLLLVNESEDPNGVSSCWQLRVFPARPEHRFRGRIHEQVQSALDATGTPTENLDVTIRHTGYLRSEDVVRKSRRNLELLGREMREGGDDINVLYHYVRAASRCHEVGEAVRVARRILDDPPPNTPREILVSTAVLLGRMEIQSNRPREAREALEQAVELAPDDVLARFFLGDLLREQGDLEGAARELRAARLAPIRQGTLPIPVAGLARAIRLQLGEVLEVLRQPAESAALYREALELGASGTSDRPVERALVRALITAGALDQAEKRLEMLDDDSSDQGERLVLAATIAFNRGRDEDAASLYRRAEAVQPTAWGPALHLGHLALRSGNVEESLPHYRRALQLADVPETRVGLAAAELEGGQVEEALGHLAVAVEKCVNRPLPAGTEALSGEALLRFGRPADAVDALEKHLARFGPDPRIVSRLADCYRALGAPEAARFGYEEALRLQPGLPEAQRGLEALGAAC